MDDNGNIVLSPLEINDKLISKPVITEPVKTDTSEISSLIIIKQDGEGS